MERKRASWIVPLAIASVAAGSAAVSAGGAGSVVRTQAELAWAAAGVPGVSTAAVEGDLASGPVRFYLRYAAGFAAPLHHHSADHFVTTVSGRLVLVLDGAEHVLPPGSYFALTGKAAHGARCEGPEDCVMFVHALGAWDVVPEPPAPK